MPKDELRRRKRERLTRYRSENPELVREQKRKHNLKMNFRMTVEQYDEMAAVQGGSCAICTGSDHDRRLAVDHDRRCCPGARSCGRCVRSLLCGGCNTGLGKFRDDPLLLIKAAAYVTDNLEDF